jgi:hypothetical protein
MVLLKALAARRLRLTTAEAPAAMAELVRFAAIIRGVAPGVLVHRASVVLPREGTEGLAGGSLTQKTSNSCAGTTALIAIGEADPFVAWVLHADGKLDGWAGGDQSVAARLQRAIITSDKRVYASTYCGWGGGGGTDPDHVSSRFATPFTGLRYERVKYFYRLEADADHTERLAQIVEAGQDVPLRLGDPEDQPSNYSHAVIITDVRGEPGQREFMILDPMRGEPEWTPQSRINEGKWRTVSYYFGESSPVRGVGRAASGRPEY